jgi:hypothetical protein
MYAVDIASEAADGGRADGLLKNTGDDFVLPVHAG